MRIPGSVKNAGFTLMRRGRVIIGGPEKNYRPYEIFGPSNLYTYQRMYGELHMDDWPVTQAKDGFDWSSEDLEARFIEKLIELTKEYHKKAEELRTREKVKVEDISNQLNKSFTNNEHISDLKISLDEVEDDENVIDDVDETIDDITEELTNQEKETLGIGVDIEGNKPISLKMKYRGKPYDITFVFDNVNRKSEWLKLEDQDKENNKFKLTLNVLNLFFYPYIQKKDFLSVLAKFATALIIAELNAYEIGQDGLVSPSSIRIAMGQILEDFTSEQ